MHAAPPILPFTDRRQSHHVAAPHSASAGCQQSRLLDSEYVCRSHTRVFDCEDDTGAAGVALEPAARDEGGDSAALQGRIKELEVMQALMQRELDAMSDLAQRQEEQLRCAFTPRPWPAGGDSVHGLAVAVFSRALGSLSPSAMSSADPM